MRNRDRPIAYRRSYVPRLSLFLFLSLSFSILFCLYPSRKSIRNIHTLTMSVRTTSECETAMREQEKETVDRNGRCGTTHLRRSGSLFHTHSNREVHQFHVARWGDVQAFSMLCYLGLALFDTHDVVVNCR